MAFSLPALATLFSKQQIDKANKVDAVIMNMHNLAHKMGSMARTENKKSVSLLVSDKPAIGVDVTDEFIKINVINRDLDESDKFLHDSLGMRPDLKAIHDSNS